MKNISTLLSFVLIFALLSPHGLQARKPRKCIRKPWLCAVPAQAITTPDTSNLIPESFFPYPGNVGTGSKNDIYDARPHIQ